MMVERDKNETTYLLFKELCLVFLFGHSQQEIVADCTAQH